MQERVRSSYAAPQLCHILKDFDGRPLSIFEQRDLDEFFNLLVGQLEEKLRGTEAKGVLQRVFAGSVLSEIRSRDCPHNSQQTETFLSLNLQVASCKSLQESLKRYVESEGLEGSNAYNCEQCRKKVNANRKSTLSLLPNVMVIFLKRFAYDYGRG